MPPAPDPVMLEDALVELLLRAYEGGFDDGRADAEGTPLADESPDHDTDYRGQIRALLDPDRPDTVRRVIDRIERMARGDGPFPIDSELALRRTTEVLGVASVDQAYMLAGCLVRAIADDHDADA